MACARQAAASTAEASTSGCCGNGTATSSRSTITTSEPTAITDSVKAYYGKVLSTSKDLKTSACTAAGRPHPKLREIMRQVPDEVSSKFYGCGAPLPLGINGLRVLDLGSGSGRDCYVASALVGPSGAVTGIDMTDEQLEVARRNVEEFTSKLGYPKPNMRFVKGFIERISEAGIEEESIDLAISNCVVNLSPDKKAVLEGVWRALAPGGEFYFSDVYADRRVPKEAQEDEVLWGECISGALYVEDFKRIAREVGFMDPRVVSSAPISVTDESLRALLGNVQFSSITFRLFKLPGRLETLCEDYGQVAYYQGTIGGHEHSYTLDQGHVFEKGRPVLVCGNTASMLEETWLAPHFKVVGDRSVHYGLFSNCGTPVSASVGGASDANTCAPGGGCC